MHKKDCTPPFIVEVNFDSVSDLGAGLVNANPSKGEEEKLQTKISGFFKTYFFPQDFAWNTARYIYVAGLLLLFCALSQQRILAIQAKGTRQTDIDICLHSHVVRCRLVYLIFYFSNSFRSLARINHSDEPK